MSFSYRILTLIDVMSLLTMPGIISEKPDNIKNKSKGGPIEPKINRMIKISEREGCTLLMEQIKSSVNPARYQRFVSIIAELYSHQSSLELFELKAHDLMKNILIWFIEQPSLSLVSINRILPIGNSFTILDYYEKESLRIILAVSCIDRVSHVDVWMFGDLGFKDKQLFRIAEYQLKERGPLQDAMVWKTLLSTESMIMTSCGLFYGCIDSECETVLEKVNSKIRRMNLSQGQAPPDDILIELYCENSLAEQEIFAMQEASLHPKVEPIKADGDVEWTKFVKARSRYEESILAENCVEEAFTGTAERVYMSKSTYIENLKGVVPSLSSDDRAVEVRKIITPLN